MESELPYPPLKRIRKFSCVFLFLYFFFFCFLADTVSNFAQLRVRYGVATRKLWLPHSHVAHTYTDG